METLEKFKEIIKNKAKKRAYQEVCQLQKQIQESGLLELSSCFDITNSKGFNSKFENSFLIGRLGYSDEITNPITALYKEKYFKYIEEETDVFIKKMELLTTQVDDLFSLKKGLKKNK